MPSDIDGPFGVARYVESVPITVVAQMYQAKCGFDVGPHLKGIDSIDLFECATTGYRFWRPESAAGDESFYRGLSAAWSNYYRDWRWEYRPMLSLLRASDRVLEVGSGRGFFLKLTEVKSLFATGLELNLEAIRNKVTTNEILDETIERYAAIHQDTFDVVCSFQVLEHVINPASFIESCVKAAKSGALIAFSTPNINNRTFAKREDAFDLPPHHVGQFSPEVYRRLGPLYGLTLESILEEPRFIVRDDSSIRAVAKRTLSAVHRILRGPGACVLALYRKH